MEKNKENKASQDEVVNTDYKLVILHHLLHEGQVFYVNSTFDYSSFIQFLVTKLSDNLNLEISHEALDEVDVINYQAGKGIKSSLGITGEYQLFLLTDQKRLYFDIKPANWLANPDKKISTFNPINYLNDSYDEEIIKIISDYLLDLHKANHLTINDDNLFIENILPKMKLWFYSEQQEKELLFVFLNISSIKKTESDEEVKALSWHYFVSSHRSGLLGFSDKGGIEIHIDLSELALTVKKEIGRKTISTELSEWMTTRNNADLYRDISLLPTFEQNDRVREIARLNWLKNKKTKTEATKFFFQYLLTFDTNPFDEIKQLFVEYKSDTQQEFETHFAENEKLDTLLCTILGSSNLDEQLKNWIIKWEIDTLDMIAILHLLIHAADTLEEYQRLMPFHQYIRDTYLKQNKDKINEIVFDIEYCKHLIACEMKEDAIKILKKRLKQLPDETVSDLLPPKDLDLTGKAGGQLLKISLLDLLIEISKPAEIMKYSLQVARLQPLIPERVDDLLQVADKNTRDRALRLHQILEAEGFSRKEELIEVNKFKELAPKLIREKIPHSAAQKGGTFESMQKWLAKVDVPDYSVVKSYSEILNSKNFTEALQVVTDIKVALGISKLETYIGRGDKSIGISSFESDPSFLIIGAEHLDTKSGYAMNVAELRFAVGVELAHLHFKHSRITSTDLWKGAMNKSYWVLDTFLAVIPLAGFFGKSLQGIAKLNAVSSILQSSNKIKDLGSKSKEILDATVSTVGMFSSVTQKDKAQDKEKELIAASRVMQLTADRAGLIFSGDIQASVRSIFLHSKELFSELPVVERYGIIHFLLKQNEAGDYVYQETAIRLTNLFSFYLSDDFLELRKHLLSE